MSPDLATLRQQLKTEKNKKGEISRQFKHLEKNSAEHRELLLAMQEISERITATEKGIKLAEEFEQKKPEPTLAEAPQNPFSLIDPNSLWQGSFSCKLLGAPEFSRWDIFVSQHNTSGYHRSCWFDLIKKSFGHDTVILIAQDEQGNIIGGLPLTFFSSKLFGQFAISIPYLNYGGVVSRYLNVAQHLIAYAQEVRAAKNLSHIEVRTMQAGLADNSLDKKVSMVLELPVSDEQLDKNLGAKVRAQYKKADEFEPSVKTGKLELLEDFYNVFSRNMRDLGTPVYSKKWFANILKDANVKATLLVVYMDKKPVATGFLVGHGNMLEIPWASTIQSANAKNANMWMYRQILSFAIKEGYSFFDFGRSTLGAGTYKFKKQWGAVAYPHHWYYVLPNGEQKPELNPDNPKYKLIIFVWKLMPIWLTQLIGPHLIKHIP
jgi:serine/alanine adding enzyme